MIISDKILVFDLDDTLYNEFDFVVSGFFNVSKIINNKFNIKTDESYKYLLNYFKKYGRAKIFDNFLNKHNIYSKKNLKLCINIYRYSNRNISIKPEARNIISKLYKKKNLYLVTDGNKIVQNHKIKLLKINKFFKKIYITHNYGIKYSKPSLYCFKKICQIENISFNNLVYIADDPNKDFINLNNKNAITIRILEGRFKNFNFKKAYDAKIKIKTFKKLLNYL